MKFTVNSNDLRGRLNFLTQVINQNIPLPITTGILFESDGKRLKLVATDLETTITTEMDVEGDGSGSFVAPAKLTSELIKSTSTQPITFTFKDGLKVTSKDGTYKISTIDAGGFPVSKSVNSKGVDVDATELIEAINSTLYATSTDELRPQLMGVYIDGDKMVATDAHRLVKFNVSSKIGRFIIPKKPLSIVAKATDTVICIAHDETNCSFTFGDYVITSRLVDAKYPDYNSIIPKSSTRTLRTKRDSLLNAVKRVSMFSNKMTHAVRLEVDKKTLSVKGSDEMNEAMEAISCDLNGADVAISFNAKYLQDALNSLKCDDVVIEMTEPDKAITITDKNISCLLMPIMS